MFQLIEIDNLGMNQKIHLFWNIIYAYDTPVKLTFEI